MFFIDAKPMIVKALLVPWGVSLNHEFETVGFIGGDL